MYCSQACTAYERFVASRCECIGQSDGLEAGAIFEGISANARHTVGNIDGREAGATREGIRANEPCTLLYVIRPFCLIYSLHQISVCIAHIIYHGETRTTIEGLIANALHTLGNRNRREAGATPEGIIPNAPHTVGNCNRR